MKRHNDYKLAFLALIILQNVAALQGTLNIGVG